MNELKRKLICVVIPTNDSRVDIMSTRQGSVRQNVNGKTREQELTGKEVARKIKKKSGSERNLDDFSCLYNRLEFSQPFIGFFCFLIEYKILDFSRPKINSIRWFEVEVHRQWSLFNKQRSLHLKCSEIAES